MQTKKSGILLHISSLPSAFGIGDLGPQAYRFADFLASSGQQYWQILPINPTDSACQDSPYSSCSALAANTLFISLEILVEENLLNNEDIKNPPYFPQARVDYLAVKQYKQSVFEKAFERFKNKPTNLSKDFFEFTDKNSSWLEDYALFSVLKKEFDGKIWSQWPDAFKKRDEKEIQRIRFERADKISFEKFLQFLFFRQWARLRNYCRKKKISFIGDIPIYVSFDSVDVWTHPALFKLDERMEPAVVAGVPPDYFSKTGQRWGNPIYNWDALQSTHYRWCVERLKMNFQLFDVVRIDHFRGLVQYWEIPASEETAVHGQWRDVPVDDFLSALKSQWHFLPVIAEDLGVITDDVKDVMKHYQFPGMKVLLFAFNGDMKQHPYLPHNYKKHCVVYTGTHDNNTVLGWFEHEATEKEKENLFNYIGGDTLQAHDVPWALVAMAMKSPAALAIIPLQDILGLGQEARMNTPATYKNNWQWRYLPGSLNGALAQKLQNLTRKTHRL